MQIVYKKKQIILTIKNLMPTPPLLHLKIPQPPVNPLTKRPVRRDKKAFLIKTLISS